MGVTEPDFAAVRAEFGLPADFPADVLAEATAAAARPLAGRPDATDVELVTIDPPGSMDLDQAVGVTRTADGFRVHYAIADLGAVVTPGGALDAEVRRRGQTVYLPDGSVPLHPSVLSDGASSLLPDGPRPAALWTIDVDPAGEPTAVDVRRALVSSRARLDYEGVQAAVDGGADAERIHPAIAALPELGRLRRALAVQRGAIELELPEQEVVRDGSGWAVRLRHRVEVEAWNAEISLLTGACAATIMLKAGVGLLRTLPAPGADDLAAFRRTAQRLGFTWTGATDVRAAARLLAGLSDESAPALALRRSATTLLRGAGYAAFDAGTPPPADPGHGGIGSPYAHVTAPLRRLVDRFGTEVCLSVVAGAEVPGWVRAALPMLPPLMAASDALAAKVERACVDRTEAAMLAGRTGETFRAVVLKASGEHAGEVLLHEPPVLAAATHVPQLGTDVEVRLVEADPATGKVAFAGVRAENGSLQA